MKRYWFLLAALALAAGMAYADEATLSPTADSPIFGSSPSSNYGGQTYGYWGYYNNPMRTLVKWNLTTVNGNVTGCKMSFQIMQNNWLATTRIWACKIQADWQEMTVTYANQPAHDTTAAGRFLDQLAPSGTGIHTLDCTTTANSIVQGWITTPATNYGVMCRTETEGNQERAYPYMKESSYQPIRLIVTYTPSGAVSPSSFGRVKAVYR